MRDFDAAREQRDRNFKIGGEEFTMRAVKPEVLIAYQDMDDAPPAELKAARKKILLAQAEHGVGSPQDMLATMAADPLEEAFSRAGTQGMLPKLDEIVLDLIDNGDGSHERWKALRARDEDALTLGDLQTLVGWMIGEQSRELEAVTGRPTVLPSSSTRGLAPTGAPSTAVSSSPAARTASAT